MAEEKFYYAAAPQVREHELVDGNTYKTILELIPHQAKSVLDCGCGSGFLAKLLSDRGAEVTGIEAYPKAALLAKQHCHEVFETDLDQVPLHRFLKGRRFDVVIFADVLEHLKNPWAVLAQAKNFLTPQGLLVASIPNIAHGAVRLALLKGQFNYVPMGILDNTHLRFFTRKTIQALFEQAQFRILNWKTLEVPIFVDTPVLPKVLRSDYSEDTVRQVEMDPESKVLQYMVQAVPISP